MATLPRVQWLRNEVSCGGTWRDWLIASDRLSRRPRSETFLWFPFLIPQDCTVVCDDATRDVSALQARGLRAFYSSSASSFSPAYSSSLPTPTRISAQRTESIYSWLVAKKILLFLPSFVIGDCHLSVEGLKKVNLSTSQNQRPFRVSLATPSPQLLCTRTKGITFSLFSLILDS